MKGQPVIGSRLRALRVQYDLTLRDVATKADVSQSLLSQIEHGTAEPSLATVRKLARVFDASVSVLFAEPDAPLVHVSKPGERTRLTAPKGLVTYDRITPGRGGLEVLQAELAPGDASSPEPWAHASTECMYVLDGVVTVEIEDKQHTVDAGDAITFDSLLPHRYVNLSDCVARLLLSVTPPNP